MISLQRKGLRRHKGHSKTNSTDTLNSQKRLKGLSVISASGFSRQNTCPYPSKVPSKELPSPGPMKTVHQLRKMAMGHRPTRSVSQQLNPTFSPMDQNTSVRIQNQDKLKRRQKEHELRLKPTIVNLSQWSSSIQTKPQTPINKLLFESTYKQNWFK